MRRLPPFSVVTVDEGSLHANRDFRSRRGFFLHLGTQPAVSAGDRGSGENCQADRSVSGIGYRRASRVSVSLLSVDLPIWFFTSLGMGRGCSCVFVTSRIPHALSG